jgi:hypothetical protein
MYIGETFRKHGLGETIRDLWEREGINPPRMTDAQTWAWINRSDVAFGLVHELVWDPRLVLLGAAACIGPAAQYVSKTSVDLVRATERAAYGIDLDAWVSLMGAFAKERDEELERKGRPLAPLQGHPIHTHRIENPDWQDWGFAAVCSLSSALGAARQGAPDTLVRRELKDGVKYAWSCLRQKFRTVDSWPDSAAIRCANELQLRLLRQVITTETFTAPYTRKRSDLL